jgi:hydroxyacylglutathione hydrolase
VKLTEDVYLVGGGNVAFNLSNGADCHVYVIRSGDALAMVDVGVGLGTDLVIENMRRDGLDPKAVRQIFVTHYHVDHAGALKQWRDLTGAKVYASSGSAPAIRAGDAETVGLTQAQKGGYYPLDYRLEPCPVDVVFDEGQDVRIGDLALKPYASPGHCNGHTVYRLDGQDRRYLFSGDCVFWGGHIIIQNIPDCNLQAYAQTIEKLTDVEFDALLPGHLTISLRDGRRHIDAAAKAFRSLGIPRNAVQL